MTEAERNEIKMRLGEWESYGWVNATKAIRKLLAENDALIIEAADLRKEAFDLRNPTAPILDRVTDPNLMFGNNTTVEESE